MLSASARSCVYASRVQEPWRNDRYPMPGEDGSASIGMKVRLYALHMQPAKHQTVFVAQQGMHH